jgi:hypothetical protein
VPTELYCTELRERSVGRTKHRSYDNIEMDLMEIEYGFGDWTQHVQNKYFVNTAMSLYELLCWVIFEKLQAECLSTFQESSCISDPVNYCYSHLI